jgi:hypothetical protein
MSLEIVEGCGDCAGIGAADAHATKASKSSPVVDTVL